MGRKRHVLVDTEGLVLAVRVTAANVQDRHAAPDMLQHARQHYPHLAKVWVDGGYKGLLQAWAWHQQQIHLEVVQRLPGQRGFQALPRRWVSERTFAWLGRYRRLSKDYEAYPDTACAMIYAAMSGLMLNRLVRLREAF